MALPSFHISSGALAAACGADQHDNERRKEFEKEVRRAWGPKGNLNLISVGTFPYLGIQGLRIIAHLRIILDQAKVCDQASLPFCARMAHESGGGAAALSSSAQVLRRLS